VRETEDEVTAVMRNARHLAPEQEENFSVNRQDKLLEGFNQMMKATNVTGILVGVITAIVAGIGIMKHPAGLGEGADAREQIDDRRRPEASAIPTAPPTSATITASQRNCQRMVPRRAPTACGCRSRASAPSPRPAGCS